MLTRIATLLLFGAVTFQAAAASSTDAPAMTTHKDFTILHSNDEHAALVPSPVAEFGSPGARTRGGIARVAMVIERIRAEKSAAGEEVLVVSSGDFISGSPFSWLVLNESSPELDLMQMAGYDVVTLGNHEFDYGPEILAEYLKRLGYPATAAKLPIVASNTVIPDGHALGETGLRNTYIRELDNGLRVGFFGLMGKHADSVAPMAESITFADQHETARAMVAELRNAGADVIVLLSHSGEAEEQELAAAVPGIDVIIGGHTHAILAMPIRVGSTLIVQTGTEYQYLGKLELRFENGRVVMRNHPTVTDKPYLIPINDDIPPHPAVEQRVNEYRLQLNQMLADMTSGILQSNEQPVVYSAFTVSRNPRLSETPMGNLVADAMLYQGSIVSGRQVDVAFQASGVIRGNLEPARTDVNKGQISFHDLAKTIGLGSGPDNKPGYPMISAYLTGTELRRAGEVSILLSQLMGDTYFLQTSGLRWTYAPERSLWLTIPFLGTPIPSGRAIQQAWIYRGNGMSVMPSRLNDRFVELPRTDEQLYHVVSDFYIAQFLPMVGDVVPHLAITLKDEQGNPINSLEERILYYDGREYKVWQAVTDYLMSQSTQPTSGMLPAIPARYQGKEGRQVVVNKRPYSHWFGYIGGLSVAFIIALIANRIRARKRREVTTT
ncbi:MAG: bifunctional metallophosphatase/5'-nucleotidase [Bacteroidetes bacterium]|nr:bifunctional metallophosphatase/5'-nucleotidase [Bacteroidota bacterium]